MKVLIVEPGKYPREADIEHTLEAEQAVVGGTIEAVYPCFLLKEPLVEQFQLISDCQIQFGKGEEA